MLAALLLGAGSAPAAAAADGDVAFSFQDREIVESSGLVALGTGLFATTNDSGDEGRVFTVDDTGRTVGVTHWSIDGDGPDDVEALAPAGGGTVWVGDIGDNGASRDSVRVAQVPVGRGERSVSPAVYDLVYPDGPHDAETLFTGPAGRLYIATKEFLGGSFYAAPAALSADGPNRLEQVGAPGVVLPMATDGALWTDGKHVLIRGYVSATLYDFPSFDRVGSLPLPKQRQGEGLAVASDGTVYLSSEGVSSDVLRVAGSRVPVEAAPTAPSDSPRPERGSSTGSDASSTDGVSGWWWLAVGGGVAAVVYLQSRLLRRPRRSR